jgi:hypothetical protein
MPRYFFHAADKTEIEGHCDLPDDDSAVRFAEDIARQLTENTSGGASVSVTDEDDEPICDIIVQAPTLH